MIFDVLTESAGAFCVFTESTKWSVGSCRYRGAVSRGYWDVSERTLYAIRLEMGNQCRDRRTVTMLQRIRSGHDTRSSILGLLKINVNHCSSPGLTFGSGK